MVVLLRELRLSGTETEKIGDIGTRIDYGPDSRRGRCHERRYSGAMAGLEAVAVHDDSDGHSTFAICASETVVMVEEGDEITETDPVDTVLPDRIGIACHDIVVPFRHMCGPDAGTHADSGNDGRYRYFQDTSLQFPDVHGLQEVRIEIEERDVRIILQSEALTSTPDDDGVAVEHLFLEIPREIDNDMLRTSVMAENDTFSAFRFTCGDRRPVPCAGIDLEADIGVLERFVGIGRAAHSRLYMVSCPSESRIPGLYIEGYAPYGGENERRTVMIHFPVTPGSRLAGLALQKEFHQVLFVCPEHDDNDYRVYVKTFSADHQKKERSAMNALRNKQREGTFYHVPSLIRTI